MFMQQPEDAQHVSVFGNYLIVMATVCFTAFSIVMVQYKKCCMLQQCKTLTAEV
jgi:hypothetical protein